MPGKSPIGGCQIFVGKYPAYHLDAVSQEAEDSSQPEQKGKATKQVLAEFHLFSKLIIKVYNAQVIGQTLLNC